MRTGGNWNETTELKLTADLTQKEHTAHSELSFFVSVWRFIEQNARLFVALNSQLTRAGCVAADSAG